MADIARLGFDIDTAGLTRANTELQSLIKNASQAQKAAASLSATIKSIPALPSGGRGGASGAASATAAAAAAATAATAATALAQAQAQVGTATTAAATALNNAAAASTRAAAAQTAAAQAAQRQAAANTNVAASSRAAANANAAQEVSIGGLLTSFKTLAAVVAGGYISKSVDTYIQLQNSLMLAGQAGEQLVETEERLFNAANKNGQEIGEVANLYRRASVAAKGLGASNQEILSIVDGVTAALKIQGTSARQAQGVMLQFTQALGSGTVRAEEFNSIMEGGLPIAQAAARGWEGGAISVGNLRNKMLAGEVTSKQFFQALQRGFGITKEQAEAMSLTIGQSMTVLNNALIRVIGTFDQITGASKAFTKVLSDVALYVNDLAAKLNKVSEEDLQDFAANLTAAAVIMSTVLIPTLVRLGAAAVATAARLLLLNPVGLFITGIALVLTAIYNFRDEIAQMFGVDVVKVFNDVANVLAKSFLIAVETVKFLWTNFADIMTGAYQEAANAVIGIINNLVKIVKVQFYGLYNTVKEVIDKLRALNPWGATSATQDAIKNTEAATADLTTANERLVEAQQAVQRANNTTNQALLKSAQERVNAAQQVLAASKANTEQLKAEEAAAKAAERARQQADVDTPAITPYSQAGIQARRDRIAANEAGFAKRIQEIKDSNPIDAIAVSIGKAVRNMKLLDDAAGGVNDKLKKGKALDPYQKLINDGMQFIATKQRETEALGQNNEQTMAAKNVMELFNKAQDQGIKLDAARKATLTALGIAMGQAEAAAAKAKAIFGVKEDFQKQIQNAEIEAKTVTMSTEAALAYKSAQEKINELRRQGHVLQQQDIADIEASAAAMAKATVEAKNYADVVNIIKDTGKDIFKGMFEALRTGKSLWEVFANAATKALDKIIDKLADVAMDNILDFLGGGSSTGGKSGTSGSSSFGGLGKLFSGDFSGIGKSLSNMWTNTPTWLGGGGGMSAQGQVLGTSNASFGDLGGPGGTFGQGIGGSGISAMGAIGAIGGGISGAMQIAKGGTANTIGGITSMIGAGVSLIPGIGQIAGPIISILGSVLPSLIGESKPTITNQEYGEVGWQGSGFGTSGGAWGPEANAKNLTGPLGQLGQNMQSVFDAFGGVQDASKVWGVALKGMSQQYGDGSTFSSKTSFLVGPDGQRRQWGQGSTEGDVGLEAAGVAATLESLLGGAVGEITENMRKGLGTVNQTGKGTFEELATVVTEIMSFDKTMATFGHTVTAAEKQIMDINSSFDDMYALARKYGFAQSEVNKIDAERNRLALEATKPFVQEIGDALLEFADPLQAQLVKLDREKEESLKTNATYVSMVQGYTDQAQNIELLYLQRRNKIIEDFNAEANAAMIAAQKAVLAGLADLIAQYMPGGKLAGESAVAHLAGLKSVYEEARQAAMASPLDEEVVNKFIQASTDLAEYSKDFNAANKDYVAQRNQLIADAQAIQALAGGASAGVGGQEAAQAQLNDQMASLLATVQQLTEQLANTQAQNAQLSGQVARLLANRGS